MRALGDVVVVKLVGVTFADGYPMSLFEIEHRLRYDEASTGGAATPVPVGIRREPLNVSDANAVAIEGPDRRRLGHVPARLAARLAPELDAGAAWRGEVVNVAIHPQEPLHPGLDVRLVRAS